MEARLDRVDARLAGHDHRLDKLELNSEATLSQLELLAEGVRNVGEKLDRTADRLDRKIDTKIDETQAMIRVSFSSLDRRVTALEANR